MTTIKLTPYEVKLAKRALNQLEENSRKQGLLAAREGKTGVSTRFWNDVSGIIKVLQKLGQDHHDASSASRLSQVALEVAAADAHEAAFKTLDRYNLPDKLGSHRELTNIRKRDLEAKIIPGDIMSGWQPGEKNALRVGRIKIHPTEAPLLFCQAVEIGEQCEIKRESVWYPYSQIDRAYEVIETWSAPD